MSKKNHSAERSKGSPTITLGSLSDVGLVRENNQDSCSALLAPAAPLGADAMLVVADGMGGHRAGDKASQMAISELATRLSEYKGGGTLLGTSAIMARLQSVVKEVNDAVHLEGTKPEFQGMGTTLTSVLILGNKLVLCHVGDSRGYLLRGENITQITKDHSWVAEQLEAGVITPLEAEKHPYKNVLTRAIGTSPEVSSDSDVLDVSEGDTILLCSDGLHNLVSDEEISGIVNSSEPKEACEELVELAKARGGHDNVTVVIGQIGLAGKNRKKGDLKSSGSADTTLVSGSRSRSSWLAKPFCIVGTCLMVPARIILWPIRTVISILLYPLRSGRRK